MIIYFLESFLENIVHIALVVEVKHVLVVWDIVEDIGAFGLRSSQGKIHHTVADRKARYTGIFSRQLFETLGQREMNPRSSLSLDFLVSFLAYMLILNSLRGILC